MKKISVLIPSYNERDNVAPLTYEIEAIFRNKLKKYAYEIIFIDNCSEDGTRAEIEKICARNKKVKAIFNARNFGYLRSPFYGLLQARGDCVIMIAADFQDPPEMIVEFVRAWEKGAKIVAGIKKKSRENPALYFLRSVFYSVIRKIADVGHISHFTGFGLYDKAFIDVLRKLDDPMPYLRGMVAEFGFKRVDVPYEQQKRKAGRTKSDWWSLYDVAMLGITSYSKMVMRLATILGFVISGVSFMVAVLYLVLKLIFWFKFPIGTAPMIISIFFLGSVQLFFIGFLGEYILNINTRVMKRPLVVEERRINI
ncbi:MAG TPA: glycosyltransferase family 2 protein [Candidatus Goldiibacteriota bacterium]|nr:glycosyltransferase family 2 protein [Candidatus Goldiibacteriota bacterium]